jgi:hypothetical protein
MLKENILALASEIYKFPNGLLNPWFSRYKKTYSSEVSMSVKLALSRASLGK